KEVKKPAPAPPKTEKKEVKETKGKVTSKKLPAVPESVLKSRRRRDASKASKLKAQLKKKLEKYKKRKLIFKRAEQYIREYRTKERDEIR
ncbi:hypothetical protein L6232_24290, partial [Shewanella sp. C31]|nr:hypothetical protein [Shewanella electrica]